MFTNTDLTIITTKEELEKHVKKWKTLSRIAVDLEGDSLYSYQEKICLIQITDNEQDYIIDPLALNDLTSFFQIIEDPKIIKIMHGANFDIVSFKRDYNVNLQNLFDTSIAAQFLGYERFGLSALILEHFGIVLEKRFQTYNWSKRPLWNEHLNYARGDTHFLLALHEIFDHKLRRSDYYDAVTEECWHETQKEWNGKQNDGADFLRIKSIRSIKTEKQLRALRELYRWREMLAEKANIPVFKIFLNKVLLVLASALPKTDEELKDCLSKEFKYVYNRYGMEIVKVIEDGLATTDPLPKNPKRKREQQHAKVAELSAKIRTWREKKQAKGILPIHLLSNQQIKDIAIAYPNTEEELAAIPSIRNWQIERYGKELLQFVK